MLAVEHTLQSEELFTVGGRWGAKAMLGQSCMETNVMCASRQTNHPHKLIVDSF